MDPTVGALLKTIAEKNSISELEHAALSNQTAGFEAEKVWREFQEMLLSVWHQHDHVVVRNAPVIENGSLTLLLARVIGSTFKSYRGSQIVKHFRMSPWTTDLSQTTRDGDFHTDVNTSECPPKITIIHCLKPDPAPDGGALRVARLDDLLAALRFAGEDETLDFLENKTVKMVNDRSDSIWQGAIVDNCTIRYHPCTLRAASQRHPEQANWESCISVVHRYATEVSTPIILNQGDALIVSNTRALHYRGPCNVRFRTFPRDFESREIFVLHLNDEPKIRNGPR